MHLVNAAVTFAVQPASFPRKHVALFRHSYPHLNHGYDVTWIQQVNHSLGGEFEADLHSKSHAQGDQQQVLAQTVLFRLDGIFAHHLRVSGDADLLQRHADLHQGDDGDDHALNNALPAAEEGGTLGAPVALELRVHAAVDPVQQAVYVIPGHIPLLVLEEIRTRRNERRHTDLLAKHELQDFPLVAGATVEK